MPEIDADIRLTATPLNDMQGPDLFSCDLCTAVVTNPQQHFKYHEAVLHAADFAQIFTPFIKTETGSLDSPLDDAL